MNKRTSLMSWAMASAIAGVFDLASGGARGDTRVLTVTVPSHLEWCAISKFAKDAVQTAAGQEKMLETGSAPILNAAFKAGAKQIGHVYVRSFEAADAEISATFCAVMPPSLQTNDVAIIVTPAPATEYLAEICDDPDRCRADISKVLKDEPYKFTDEQIDDAVWRYAGAPISDNTADAIVAGLNEFASTPLAGKPDDKNPDALPFTIVAVPKPTPVKAPGPDDAHDPSK